MRQGILQKIVAEEFDQNCPVSIDEKEDGLM